MAFTKAEVEARRVTVSEMYLASRSLREIAVTVGVTHPMVLKDLKFIRTQWRSSALHNFDQARNLELSRIDALEAESWNRFTKGIGRHIIKRKETDAEGKVKITETVELLNGDPRFLHVIIECIKRRCAILGLDAPAEMRVTGKLDLATLREILTEAGEQIQEAVQ